MKGYGYLNEPASSVLWVAVLGGAFSMIIFVLLFSPREKTETPPLLNREAYEHIISELHRENDARKDSIKVLKAKARRRF